MGETVHFRILGTVGVVVDGEPIKLVRRRERHLLALLLLEVGRPVPIHRLIDLLWPDDPPGDARATLHTAVSRLRAALAGVNSVNVVHDGDGYTLLADPETVDAYQFRRLVERAAHARQAATRAELARHALSLWRGEALADVATAASRSALCAGLNELRKKARDLRIGADLECGRHQEVIAELADIVAADPLDERSTAHLVLALYRSGRRNEALAICQQSRSLHADQLGLELSPGLRQLESAVLRDDPALEGKPAPTGDNSAAFPIPAQLPPDVRGFAGRLRELDRLDTIAFGGHDRAVGTKSPTAVPIAAVTGTAGVGKTNPENWHTNFRPDRSDLIR